MEAPRSGSLPLTGSCAMWRAGATEIRTLVRLKADSARPTLEQSGRNATDQAVLPTSIANALGDTSRAERRSAPSNWLKSTEERKMRSLQSVALPHVPTSLQPGRENRGADRGWAPVGRRKCQGQKEGIRRVEGKNAPCGAEILTFLIRSSAQRPSRPIEGNQHANAQPPPRR